MSNSSFNPRSLGALQPFTANNPVNIVSARAPGTHDKAPIGQLWINTATNAAYILTSITNGLFTWTGTGGTGAGTFATVTITGGAGTVLDVQQGNVVVTAGDLTLTNGDLSVAGLVDITGATSITGDFAVNAPDILSLTGTFDGARAIYLHADGGAAETIQIRSEQGTLDTAVNILADEGGIRLSAPNSTSASAITISAPLGTAGIVADSVAIVSTAALANSIDILASDAAGGVHVTAGTAGISLIAAGNVSVTPGTATSASPTATATINARVGVATFTGFTTAAAASQTFTITSNKVLTTSGVLAFATNLDASGNHAALAITGTVQSANTLAITVKNNGSGALGAGDNVLITFWVIS